MTDTSHLATTDDGALLERMGGFERDHAPDGWPAIQMRDVTALCDLVERLAGGPA